MLKWEYRTVEAHGVDPGDNDQGLSQYFMRWEKALFRIDDFLNLLGADGWELAAVVPLISRMIDDDPSMIVVDVYTYHFKRMREE